MRELNNLNVAALKDARRLIHFCQLGALSKSPIEQELARAFCRRWRLNVGYLPDGRFMYEGRFVQTSRRHQIIHIYPEHNIEAEGRTYRADFFVTVDDMFGVAPLSKFAVLVEADGDLYHSSKDARDHDHERDQNILIAGYPTLRYSGRKIKQSPDAIVRKIERVIFAKIRDTTDEDPRATCVPGNPDYHDVDGELCPFCLAEIEERQRGSGAYKRQVEEWADHILATGEEKEWMDAARASGELQRYEDIEVPKTALFAFWEGDALGKKILAAEELMRRRSNEAM